MVRLRDKEVNSGTVILCLEKSFSDAAFKVCLAIKNLRLDY